MFFRSDQFYLTLTVEGLALPTDSWDVFSGGEKKTAGLKIFTGGMTDQEELGGTPEREPIKLSRKWSDVLVKAYKALDNATGYTPCEVSVWALDNTKKRVGEPDTYNGMLGEVKRPDQKAGPSEVAELSVTVLPNGSVS